MIYLQHRMQNKPCLPWNEALLQGQGWCPPHPVFSCLKAPSRKLIDEVMKEDGINATRAAESLGVSPKSVSRWQELQVQAQDSLSWSLSALTLIIRNHTDPENFLDDIQQYLENFVAEWRDRVMPLSWSVVIPKAGQLKPSFKEMTLSARKMCVSRILVKRATWSTGLQRTQPQRSAFPNMSPKMQRGTWAWGWLSPSLLGVFAIRGSSTTWTRQTITLCTRPRIPYSLTA